MTVKKKPYSYLFLVCALSCTLFAFAFPKNLKSQPSYSFDFTREWTWEDMVSAVIDIDVTALNTIDNLKKQITIEDARIIFYNLSRLSSLSNIHSLHEVITYEREDMRARWEPRIKKALEGFEPDDDLPGIIQTVVKLTQLRSPPEPGAPSFKNKTYLPQPVMSTDIGINISFNYAAAQSVLDYYSNNNSSGGTMDILSTEPYRVMLEYQKLDDVTADELMKMLEYSHKDEPLHNVYKWINPASFRGFGGVSLFYGDFRKVLEAIQNNEENIKLSIMEHLSGYMPANTVLNSELMPLFGSGIAGFSYNGKLGVNLEYPSDDYKYLLNLFTHQIFQQAQDELQLPVFELIVKKEDSRFLDIMDKIMRTGCANYIGPLGYETRPSNLLEKDFQVFNKAFKYLYNSKNRSYTDSLIRSGFTHPSPFYTMGTQMAYIIETVAGKKALLESIMLGPVYFFDKYIEAYNQSSTIRGAFKFSGNVEKKVSQLKGLVQQEILEYSVVLKRNRRDAQLMDNEIKSLFQEFKMKEDQALLNFIAGKLYLSAGDFNAAKEYFLKGLAQSPYKSRNAAIIGDYFMSFNAFPEAYDFYNISISDSPGAVEYEKRGIYFYKTGDMAGAKLDFQKALSMDPLLRVSNLLLSRIN
jgi:tetratricopeptide (TPR) repeat protein